MDLLRKLLIAILALSFTVFVALFGRIPAFRNTPIGLLHRLLCLHTPRAVHRADVSLTGGRLSKSCSRFGHYIMFERHPLVLIFFLALLTSASLTFVYKAWPLLPQVHHIIIPPLLATPYIATYACARSNGSTITRANHAAHLRAYPYDHTLYHPRVPCRTCAFSKPARSKHCSVCGVCVARADHHCAWVNNCIGRANYGWFLLLVASLGVLLTYGTFLAVTLLGPRVPPARNPATDSRRAAALRWAATVGADPVLGGIGLLAASTAPLAWGLLAYHAYLVYAGTTTNETSKWASLADAMQAGKAWRASRSAVLQPDAPASPPTSTTSLAPTPSGRPQAPQPWAAPPLTPLFERDEEDALESSGSSSSDAGSDASGGAGTAAAVADAAARWPLRSEQIVVRTRDGKVPVLPGQLVGAAPGGRRGGSGAVPGAWERVWRLEQVENLYDLGLWGNAREALWPAPLAAGEW